MNSESCSGKTKARFRATAANALCLISILVFVASRCPAQPEADGSESSRETELLRALQDDPKNSALWFSLGVARAQLKKTDPAIDAFEKALPLAADPAPVYFNLGLLYMQKPDLEKAEQAYRSGLALDSSNVAANQNYAFLLMKRGDYRAAVVPLERLKTTAPSDISTRASLVDAYLKAGLADQGQSELEELLNAHLVTPPQGLALAKLLVADRQPDLARHALGRLAAAWPASPQIHGELGLLLAKNEQFKEAAAEFEQAVGLAPDSLRYSLGFAEALIRSEQYPAALQFLQKATARFVNQPALQYQLALTDVCLQRFTEAATILEDLERASPGAAKVQFLLGGSYELQGQPDKAEAAYRTAVERAPQEPEYYRVLASMLQKQGPARLDESIRLLRRALILDPEDGESKIVLARCLEKQGQLDQAASLLEQAVSHDPGSRRAHTALAELYRRQKKMAQAEQEQSIAAKLEDRKIDEWTIWGRDTTGAP